MPVMLRSHLYIVILSALVSLVAWPSHAQHYKVVSPSVRALGMGNAYTAIVQNSDSLFYNPAGLAMAQGYHWTIADPRIYLGSIESYEKFADLQTDDGFSSAIRDLYGANIVAGGGWKSAVVTPFIAFSYYWDGYMDLAINNPAVPEFETQVIGDVGYALGAGFSILPGLQVGMVMKRIYREGARKTLGSTVVGELTGDPGAFEILDKGVGYSADFGVNIAPAVGPIQPVISLVWRDLGRTKFRAIDSSSEAPPSDEENMILGFSTIIDLPFFTISPSFEYQYLNNTEIQTGKKINLGLELGMPLIDVRAGFHQGYYTMGVGLALGFLRIDAATYGVEMGAFPGQKEDRRYALQLTLELGFDTNLSFLSGGGGNGADSKARRRLKKRR